MTVSSVTSSTATSTDSTATSSAASATSTGTQQVNSEMFLQMLVTQLKNQDPSSPMDSNEMLTQMTQLASMEQMTTLSSNSSSSYTLQAQTTASSMIGKTVDYTNSSGTATSGVVSSVSFSGSTPELTVGSDTVALSSVTGVQSGTANA